jgi:hypothetical protein
MATADDKSMDTEGEDEPELTPQEVKQWAELCCWTTLILALLLWWFNGSTASIDQFAVRTVLVVLAAAGVVGLLICALHASASVRPNRVSQTNAKMSNA